MSENVRWHAGAVDRASRSAVTRRHGTTVWLTGLSASGKSTITHAAEAAVVVSGHAACTLDGDNIRHGLNADSG